MKKKFEIEVLIKTFKEFKNKIYKYNYPEELFEEITGNSIDDKLVFLKDKFKELMQDYSADKYAHYNDKELFDLSSDIARRILELEKIAEEQILNGTYGTKNSSSKNSFAIKGKEEYRILEMVSRETVIDIFNGEFGKNDNTEKVTIKVSRNTDDEEYILNITDIEFNNNMLLNEIKTLKHIASIKDIDFRNIRLKHYPILIDDFKFDGRQISVLKYNVEGYDFISLREKFKNGVPLYHVCWIMERMLSAIGHLHFNNILLGNIIPSGIYVFSNDHNIRFTDYTFSLIDYTSENAKYIGFMKDYTAPEVLKKVSPSPKSDIYSLGMNIIYLLGGDVETNTLPDTFEMLPGQKVDMDGVERIRSLVLSFIAKNPKARSDDAWKAYHQLRQLRTITFGKTGFIEFNIPI